jgi:cell division initiation protein
MVAMDASQSALDSLRTVEFRETLKGYHRDDVDEYLEKAAVEAEGLQEQLRQSGERLRQAAERISQLELALDQQPEPQPAEPAVPDDTLQRTLLLAQKFVDETKADAEAHAAQTVAEAEAKARMMTDDAQSQASQIAAESEQRLRDEISRLETSRSKLTQEVDSMSRHLEGERNRLRSALGDILRWVDENVQPAHPPAEAVSTETAPVDGGAETAPVDGGAPAAATPAPAPAPAAAPAAASGNRSASPEGGAVPQVSGTGPSGEVTQMKPAGVSTRPANTNSPLPL